MVLDSFKIDMCLYNLYSEIFKKYTFDQCNKLKQPVADDM